MKKNINSFKLRSTEHLSLELRWVEAAWGGKRDSELEPDGAFASSAHIDLLMFQIIILFSCYYLFTIFVSFSRENEEFPRKF